METLLTIGSCIIALPFVLLGLAVILMILYVLFEFACMTRISIEAKKTASYKAWKAKEQTKEITNK